MVLATAAKEPKRAAMSDRVSRKRRHRVSPSELEILTLLADKPLLSGKQIALLRTSSTAWTWRLLGHLEKRGLLVSSIPPAQVDTLTNRCYHLSDPGIRELARREGTTPGRYARERWLSRSRLTTLFNSLDHTRASRQFFVDLATRARKYEAEGLEVWLDEAAASRRYLWHGEVRLLRPDGYGVYRQDGRRLAFFLEWDSGNSGIKRHRRKLRTYHECRATLDDQTFPAILIVTVQDRVRQLNRAAIEVSQHRRDHLLPLLIARRTELESAGAFKCPWLDVRRQQIATLESIPDIWVDVP